MDPFKDIFSFLNNTDDVKEKNEVQNFPDNNKVKRCKPCEDRVVPNECTHIKQGKTRGKKTIGKYSCVNCEFTSDQWTNLKGHNEIVHLKVKHYRCSVCFRETYYRTHLEYHIRQNHKGEQHRVLIIDCPLCDKNEKHEMCVKRPKTMIQYNRKNGKSRNSRKQDWKDREEIKGDLKCLIKGGLKCLAPDCTYVTDLQASITKHYHFKHIDRLVYSCNICSYRGYNARCVRKHQLANHRGDQEARVVGMGCQPCEKNIEHKRHLLIARPFEYGKCFLCKNGVKHSEHEFTIVRTNSGPNPEGYTEECSICGIKLKNLKFQIQHYQKEHPNDRIFKCKDCKYATNYLPNLNTHTSSKHEQKVWQCSHCSYNTTWKNTFLMHMRSVHSLFQKKSKNSVESEAQPILCDDCGFSTFNQNQFNSHKLANCKKGFYNSISKYNKRYKK